MCNCKDSTDMRGRCQPFTKEYLECPVRHDSAVWFVQNTRALYFNTLEMDFSCLNRFFYTSQDKLKTAQFLIQEMLDDIATD